MERGGGAASLWAGSGTWGIGEERRREEVEGDNESATINEEEE